MSNKNKNKNVSAVAEKAVEVSAPAVEIAAPVAEVQEIIAAEAVAAPVVEKKAKNKPNETTRTIEMFADDTKGIRTGTLVSFKESNKPDAKTMTGKVQRVFDFYLKPARQEAKIKGDNGNRYYRFEKDLIVIVAEAAAPEATA
jgi:hypothetical protein